ncbi:MAG: ATP-binding protein, partial [Caulobacteraceae bacterium]
MVAFSGGGDSLALLLIAKAWADGAARRLVAATVDHRLQPASADWARWCAGRA